VQVPLIPGRSLLAPSLLFRSTGLPCFDENSKSDLRAPSKIRWGQEAKRLVSLKRHPANVLVGLQVAFTGFPIETSGNDAFEMRAG
jgi:hypothetical protein